MTTYYKTKRVAKAQATRQFNKCGTKAVVKKCDVMGYYLVLVLASD